jgi:hypothetical protein
MSLATDYNKELKLYKPVSLEELDNLVLLKRLDKKYVFPIHKMNDLLQLASKDYQILEINQQRSFFYETHYFDTPDFDSYINHHNRRLSRFKIRQRFYDVNKKYFLEVKQKNNKNKTIKKRIEINAFGDLNDAAYQFIESVIPLENRNYIQASSNSFNRITLVSFKTKERITIDFNLCFETRDKKQSFSHFAIAELKQEKQRGSSPFSKILKELSIYPRSFSKYCSGIAILQPEMKQNLFKKNINYLNKINYDKHSS